ncbi:MAG: LPS-assembly protein LptD [Pyrinomonadaceae bacterium]
MRLHIFLKAIFFAALLSSYCVCVSAQQGNPVERQIANPMTDTPNVNPVSAEPETKLPQVKKTVTTEGGNGDLVVYSDNHTIEGKEGSRIDTHTGNVDARYGIYRLQADKITVYEATNTMVAEGSVVFDQGNDQRITGTKAEFNYKTKLGYFENSTGFTNQTNDGTVIYFTAKRVERVSLDEVVVMDGKFTACEDNVPKWSFTTKRASIKTGDAVRLKTPIFRVKDVPIIPLPYARISLKKQDRQSGFLTPTFGYSANKGFRLSTAYYQTLGRSADVTLRNDIYSARGLGFGFDVRTRANSRSYFDFGFYTFKDRIFGNQVDATHPDQGGTSFYAQGVQYFSNGFTAAADVRQTSSLAFRQVFSDRIQQIISPIELSQVFINKSWNDYTFNLLARSEQISIPNVRVKTKSLPGISFEKRPSELSFFKDAYFSFKTAAEGVSRRESVDDINLYRSLVGSDPIETPALVQRLDVHPQVTIPFSTKYFSFAATGGFRSTYYSNSLSNDGLRKVLSRDLIRNYGEFEFDVRPVALAKNYYKKDGEFLFRHTIEPFVTYRYITGINKFNEIIRFDYEDTETDTNEIEYGVTNRFFTRHYTEAVTPEAKKLQREHPDPKKTLAIQPYEIFSLTVRGKYFFDPYFGGALVPGQRNQIAPITDLTFYTFGGIPRRFSPLNIDATYRPRRLLFVNTRMDVGVQGDGLRDISATVGYDSKLLKIYQTFYYTRAIDLMPSFQQFRNAAGKEAGTLRGSQYSPSIFAGDRNKGIYGGVSLFFDFENRRALQASPLISSLGTLGYAFDCCAVTLQAYTFNIGARRENKFVFSFKLNGIGTFGTEQFGQALR